MLKLTNTNDKLRSKFDTAWMKLINKNDAMH